MKVLHVLSQLPFKTGSGVYFSNLIENFKKHSYQQKVLFALQDSFSWDILEEEDIYSIEFKSEEIPFPIVSMSNVMPYENTIYADMTEEMFEIWTNEFTKKLKQIKEEYKPDIIFSHHLWILTSLVVDIFEGTKIIGVFHNTDLRQAQLNPSIFEKYVNNLNKLDLIFAASERQKDEIIKVYKDIQRSKILAIGGGFNQNIFYPPTNKICDDTVRLVYAAKIDPSKGIFELLKVYKELDLENATLDIIGLPDGENKKRLEELIGQDASIRVYNVKDQEELGHILREKDIFLMPSFYEGLGLMAIESLASGLYVVTTEIEALMTLLGEDLNKKGLIKYVPLPRIYDVDKPLEEDLPKFREDLKEAILKQVQKVREKKTCVIDEKDTINKLSWETLVDTINDIILDL